MWGNWNQVGIAGVVSGATRALIVFALLMASWPALAEAKGQEKTPVFIGFNQSPGPSEEALVRSFGGDVKYTYQIVNAIAASLPPSSINGLRHNPRVAYIEPDLAVSKIDHATTSGDDELNKTWGVKHIGSGAVHAAGNFGSGVRVAVLDSGIAAHSDLPTPDLGCSSDTYYGTLLDGDGHGTHVSGTIAAKDNDDSTSVIGVAPGVTICTYKVLSDTGSGYYSDIVAALNAIVAYNAANLGDRIRITSNSYGSSGYPGDTVKVAFDNSYDAGILHLGAAGNSGTPNGKGSNCIYPARWSSVVAVAATTSTDARASFSSTCAELEIAAPGANIRSTVPGGGYENWNGTSMATPHVSGTAALVLAANPGWTNDQVRARLQTTAIDLGAAGRDSQFGYGLVDADAAALGSGPPLNQPPVADAGPDQTVTDTGESGAESVTLNGAGSFDPDGSIADDDYKWTEDGNPIASGASPSVSFSVGTHTVTLTVKDDKGATDTDIVLITVQAAPPPPGAITLTATWYKVKGLQKADLSWSEATTTNVDIWRNGTMILTTANDGLHTDNIDVRGGGSYTYKVCETGTTVCSNTAIVTY